MAPQPSGGEDADVTSVPRPPARVVALVLVALSLVPTAAAHVQGARPVFQPAELDRDVALEPNALEMQFALHVPADPLRQAIRHRVYPPAGEIYMQHREDGSRAGEAFEAQFEIERILEYRDNNLDGRWEPATDTPLKVWRPANYQWRIGGIQRVQVADVQAESALWTANATASPDIRLEIVAAGKAFTDEGAFVRPQDLAIYLDVTELPARDVGSLYAMEVRARVDTGTQLALYESEEVPTALLATGERRRALFVWGGEAVFDGVEQRVDATLVDETVDDLGNRTALVVLHFPAAQREMRFVLVSALEYRIDVERGTPLGGLLALLALAAVAHTRSRRSS